jgi:predicted enzyme related to lactoylglutathione lyase
MTVRLRKAFLKVDDHERAIAFYCDALGFELREDVSSNHGRWVTVGPPSQPDVDIVLAPPAPDPFISPPDREAIGDLLAKGLLGELNLSTTDLEGTFEHLEASGADVMQEPMDQRNCVRDCVFLDPAGNVIRISHTRGSPGRSTRDPRSGLLS